MKKLALYIGGMGTTLAIYFTAAHDVSMLGLTVCSLCATVLVYHLVD